MRKSRGHTLIIGTRFLFDHPRRESFEERLRLFFSLHEERGGGFTALPVTDEYVGAYMNATVRLAFRELWAADRQCRFHTPGCFQGIPSSFLPAAPADIPVQEHPLPARHPPVYDEENNDVMKEASLLWLSTEMEMLAGLWRDAVCVIVGCIDGREKGTEEMICFFEGVYRDIPVYRF